MRHKQKIMISAWSLFAFTMASVLGSGVREIEIKPDPPEADKQIFTVRFVPDENITYDQVVFDCTLQQELTLLTPDGVKTNKTYEVGKFTSRHRNIKMVRGLDCYISFFAQMGSRNTCDLAGDTKVLTNAPVTVSRIKITTYRGGKADWTVKTNARGVYRPEQGAASNSAGVVWKAQE